MVAPRLYVSAPWRPCARCSTASPATCSNGSRDEPPRHARRNLVISSGRSTRSPARSAGLAQRGDPMKYLVVLLAVLVIVLGIAGIVYGEADDSPGLQLIGVMLVVGALALGVRTVKRSR